MKICPECHATMPNRARYCPSCGAKQIDVKDAPVEKILLDIHEPIEKQFTEQFFLALKNRVKEEHQAHLFQAFSERVYESGFRDTVARRAIALQDQVDDLKARDIADYRKINQEAELILEDLLDYFIVHFCPDLTEVDLPESILKHQFGNGRKSQLKALIMDYLDFSEEKLRMYTDFLSMPSHQLSNAKKSYLYAARDEKLWFICDTSLFGNGKEGFAMTNRTLYWKAPFQKGQRVNYSNLQSIEKEKEWIKINGHFFNVNKQLNYKMLKLLKKIKLWSY